MTDENKNARYRALAHAIQSGVAMEMNYDKTSTTPKHLRVGVNMAMVEHAALADLLMRKGLITEAEYSDALIQGLEREVAAYEKRLSEMLGAHITLV